MKLELPKVNRQSSIIYRPSSVCPSTTVEIALQISPFYAKQSQSQVRENQLKLFYNKYIRVTGHLVIQKKQTQFAERVK